MIERPKRWRGPREAIVLSVILWSCGLHLGAAQRRVSLILEPPNPQAGQGVTLAVRGGPQRFTLCEWNRERHMGDPEHILEYLPGRSPLQRNGTARSGRETVRPDCSLQITNLRQSDSGNYSVFFEGSSTTQETGQRPGQELDESYQGSVYLRVSGSPEFKIPVRSDPQKPHPGGGVTLTPQRAPGEIVFCEWLKEGSSGNIQTIIQSEQSHHSQDTGGHDRVTTGPDCSLRMTQLTTADSGTYTVKMEVLRQQQQPGQGNLPQEPGGVQEYWGQVQLQVNQASDKGPQKGQSVGLSYSAGVVVGVLLFSFAWTDTLTSLFYALCTSSSRLGPGSLL